jgi:acyl-coenzyme A synthetase/AMP-(fatty) acid ligase
MVTTNIHERHSTSSRLHIPSEYNIAAEILDRNLAAGRGSREALWYQGRTWTYAELAELTNRVGNALRALVLEREQRVLLVLPDSPELAASYLGTMKIGAVAVPCNSWLGPADYRYFLRASRARVLVTTHEMLERLEPALADAPDLRHLVIVGGSGAGANQHQWDEWVSAADAELDPADTSRDEAAFWLWTSGSTGEPKAAVHLHQDWAWCCELYARQVL